uniref:Uncharacterized protein n=1 Tax=Anopheles atroparvus TaxID=41427 RepID=A0A182IMZ3_ANOAO
MPFLHHQIATVRYRSSWRNDEDARHFIRGWPVVATLVERGLMLGAEVREVPAPSTALLLALAPAAAPARTALWPRSFAGVFELAVSALPPNAPSVGSQSPLPCDWRGSGVDDAISALLLRRPVFALPALPTRAPPVGPQSQVALVQRRLMLGAELPKVPAPSPALLLALAPAAAPAPAALWPRPFARVSELAVSALSPNALTVGPQSQVALLQRRLMLGAEVREVPAPSPALLLALAPAAAPARTALWPRSFAGVFELAVSALPPSALTVGPQSQLALLQRRLILGAEVREVPAPSTALLLALAPAAL